jgi:hypothetical protein
MHTVVHCHLLSILEAEIQHLVDRLERLNLGEHLDCAREVLSRPVDVGKSRRSPGNTTQSARISRPRLEPEPVPGLDVGEQASSAIANATVTIARDLGGIFPVLETHSQPDNSLQDLTPQGTDSIAPFLFEANAEYTDQLNVQDQYDNIQFSMFSQVSHMPSMGDETDVLAPGFCYTVHTPDSPAPVSSTHIAPSSETPDEYAPHKKRKTSREDEQRAIGAERHTISLDQSGSFHTDSLLVQEGLRPYPIFHTQHLAESELDASHDAPIAESRMDYIDDGPVTMDDLERFFKGSSE